MPMVPNPNEGAGPESGISGHPFPLVGTGASPGKIGRWSGGQVQVLSLQPLMTEMRAQSGLASLSVLDPAPESP